MRGGRASLDQLRGYCGDATELECNLINHKGHGVSQRKSLRPVPALRFLPDTANHSLEARQIDSQIEHESNDGNVDE